MSQITRDEARLLLAGMRVLTHLLERPPTPEELAELLDMGESHVRLQLSRLADLGAVALVTSAFETHAESRDETLLETLSETAGPAISEDLKAFDEKKRAESERMSRLFESGDQDARREDRHRKMDEDLRAIRERKQRNPFGDD